MTIADLIIFTPTELMFKPPRPDMTDGNDGSTKETEHL